MSLLKIIKWSEISVWDYETLVANQQLFGSKYSLICLGNILQPRKNKIKKDEYDEITDIVSKIPFKTSIIEFRKEHKTNMDLYEVLKGDLLVSNINFHQGAISLNEYDKIYASTHYQPYIINNNLINKIFLIFLLKTKKFQDYVIGLKSKGIKTESNFNFIKDLQIPLPPLDIQEQFVTNYQEKMAKIAQLKQEIEHIEEDSKNYLLSMLGLEKNISEQQKTKENLLFFKKWSDIKDWGVESNLLKEFNATSNYPITAIKEMAEINPKTELKNLNSCSFLPMEAVSTDGFILKNEEQNTKNSKGFTKFQENDIIWAKITPCMQNKKSAICKNLINGIGFGSTEFYVFRIKENTNLNFLYHFLRNDYFIEIAKKNFKGSAGQQRVPKSFLENFQIPLPPLNIQQEISSHLDELQEQIDKKKEEMAYLEILAKSEFEQAVFA